MLADGRRRRRSATPWVKYIPPITLQITLLRPQAPPGAGADRGGRHQPVGDDRVLAVRRGRGTRPDPPGGMLGDALSTPLPYTVSGAHGGLAAGDDPARVFPHGAGALRWSAEPPRRDAVLPHARFFCDVTDGWRLPHNWQRVRVALAGVAVQALFGSAAALASLALTFVDGTTGLRYGLLVVACGNMLVGLLNLIPFVKLDGYIALMSRVDIPHLRQRSMAEGRRLLARWLFGGRYEQEVSGPRWIPYFGLACMTFPIVLVTMALSHWVDLLARSGAIGTIALMLGAGCLAFYLVRGAVRVLREGIRARANPFRMAVTTIGIVAVVVFGLHTITLPYTVSGGYLRTDEGTFLVMPTNQAHIDIDAGAELRLGRGGVALQQMRRERHPPRVRPSRTVSVTHRATRSLRAPGAPLSDRSGTGAGPTPGSGDSPSPRCAAVGVDLPHLRGARPEMVTPTATASWRRKW